MMPQRSLKLAIALLVVVTYFYILSTLWSQQSPPQKLLNISTNKYIHYECNEACGGWADRLKGILSAYAWALITNRTLVLDMPEPCPLEKILDPNEIDWRSDLDYVRQSIKRNSKLSHIRRKIEYGWKDWRQLESENILEYAKNIDIISLDSGMMYMNAFSVNPHLQERIIKLGYEPKRFKLQFLMRDWYKKLFKLKPDMAKEYLKFVEKTEKTTSNFKLICVQIRAERLFIGDKKLAVAKFIDFVQNRLVTKMYDEKYKIYITTDDASVRQKFINKFGINRVLSFNDSSAHMVYNFNFWSFFTGSYSSNACEKNRNMLVDFGCLDQCDMGVVSHSGFGVLGMWNRPEPFKDFFVYSTPEYVESGVHTNHDLRFIRLDESTDTFHFSMTKGVIL